MKMCARDRYECVGWHAHRYFFAFEGKLLYCVFMRKHWCMGAAWRVTLLDVCACVCVCEFVRVQCMCANLAGVLVCARVLCVCA